MPSKPQLGSGIEPLPNCISIAYTYTYIHVLPSFKEGNRVNITAVKYHGGRNYKIRDITTDYDRRLLLITFVSSATLPTQ